MIISMSMKYDVQRDGMWAHQHYLIDSEIRSRSMQVSSQLIFITIFCLFVPTVNDLLLTYLIENTILKKHIPINKSIYYYLC